MNFKDQEFKAQAIKNFKDAVTLLNDMKIPFFLSNGTLLGCIRDNDLIAHDSDMDFGIFVEDLNGRQDELIEKFNDIGFMVHGIFGKPEDGYEISLRRKVKLDLFFYYHEGDKDTMSVMGEYRIKYVYPKIQSLITRQFLGELVFIPYEYDAYLTAQYGDWHTPVEVWDYKTSIKNGQH